MQDKARFLRALDAFGILTAVLLVFTWLYGLQIRSWYRARQLEKSYPVVSLVPHPLPDTSTASEKGLTLTEFGYQMEVPWTRVEGHKTTSTVAAYVFSGGKGLSFWNPAEMTTTVQIMKEALERSNRHFINFLGAKTEHDLLNSEFNVTPDQISPFMGKQEAYRRGMLLSLKAAEIHFKPVSEMYSFGSNGWRVFQLGDPEKDRVVEVRCFDASDRELRFIFGVERGSNARLWQPEINKVVQSLRATETKPGEPSEVVR